jgi:hypothetical protein
MVDEDHNDAQTIDHRWLLTFSCSCLNPAAEDLIYCILFLLVGNRNYEFPRRRWDRLSAWSRVEGVLERGGASRNGDLNLVGQFKSGVDPTVVQREIHNFRTRSLIDLFRHYATTLVTISCHFIKAPRFASRNEARL